MKFSALLVLFTITAHSFGQHSTLRFTDEIVNLNHQSLLMVPLQSNMYRSDINRQLAESNNLTTTEIISRFTSGIDQAIVYTFQKKCAVSSFYQLQDEESENDLNYIYDNLKYEYELVSDTKEKSKVEKLKEKFNKKKEAEYDRGGLIDGQIVTKRDDRERYMKAVIKENSMLDSVHFKFDNNFFLFINELDLNTNYGTTNDMQTMNYNRLLKLHYTLYHKNGQILTTGISTTSIPSNLYDIDKIIKSYFPILAENIFADLFIDETAD
jgi:hypothetical protein